MSKICFISANDKKFKGYEFYDKINEEFKKLDDPREAIRVPCGQCVGCQEKYSKEWACRCILEAEQWKENYFVTLTYDDLHLPCNSVIKDPKTEKEYEDQGDWDTGHLDYKEFQDFKKRLLEHWRRHYDHEGIRFYMCGEYGGQTERPHYHVIFFNLPIKPENLKVHQINKNGTVLYECKEIEKIWGKGYVSIAEVNWDTCAYVARYCMKKMKRKPREEYFENGQVPEFVHMSNTPGIGSAAFNIKMFENDEIIIKGHREKIQGIKPARYFDKMYDLINPDHMKEIKEKRKHLAEIQIKNKMQYTSLTEAEQLKVEEESKIKVWKSLKRDKI